MKKAFDYDLTNPEIMEYPYDFYNAIHRDNARAVEVKGVGYWIGRMDDIKAITKNTEIFSNSYFPEGGPIPAGVSGEPLESDVKEIFDSGPKVVNALWTTDPPKHTLHRKLVNKAFTGKWVRSMEPRIRDIANGLIDEFIDKGRTDFIKDYAVYVPMIVIAEALGMSRDDAKQFKHWSDDILSGNLDVLDHKARLRVAKSFVEANKHFEATIDERRLCPADDLITSLATAEVEGKSLDTSEVLPIVNTLMLAGNETTTNLIGNAMQLVFQYPKVKKAIIQDYSLIPGFIDEVMRFDAPVQCLYRIVTKDTKIGDITISKDSSIMLGWGTAGRDPKYFEKPDVFDIYRSNSSQNVGFGFGPHICVGLGLAKAEARIAFETLFDRLDDIQLDEEADLSHIPTFATRGYKRLDLKFKNNN
ncbi:cytochrome P450 [Hyphomicrobiales bacterium]|nr:cytochrome P450 [Hyphomicrobiales bacterium]